MVKFTEMVMPKDEAKFVLLQIVSYLRDDSNVTIGLSSSWGSVGVTAGKNKGWERMNNSSKHHLFFYDPLTLMEDILCRREVMVTKKSDHNVIEVN